MNSSDERNTPCWSRDTQVRRQDVDRLISQNGKLTIDKLGEHVGIQGESTYSFVELHTGESLNTLLRMPVDATLPHAACYNRNTGAVGKATGRRICIDFCFSDNRGSNSDVGTEGASGWPSPAQRSAASRHRSLPNLGP